MELRPIDLTELLAVVMGTSIVLIPVLAFALRYSLRPVAEALGKAWAAKDGSDRLRVLEARVVMLERELDGRTLDSLGSTHPTAPRLSALAD